MQQCTKRVLQFRKIFYKFVGSLRHHYDTRNIMNNKIEYILVDLDGTLIETDLANNMAYKEALEVCACARDFIVDVNGPRITRADIKKIFGENERAENIIRTKESIFYKYLRHTSLITSTMTLLHRYIDANKKLIMVTNCKSKRATELLAHYHIDSLFYAKFYNDCGNKYTKVLSKYSIPPQSVMLIENEEAQIRNAVMAGISIRNVIKVQN